MRLLLAIAALFLALPTQAQLRPFAFVPSGEDVWWLKKITLRPMSKSVGSHSLSALNGWRARDGVAAEPFCFVDAYRLDAIISPDRETELQIREYLARRGADQFSQDFTPSPGMRFNATIGAYETCDGESGAMLIVTDLASGAIALIHEVEEPFRYLLPADGKTVAISSCFECGDINRLYLDISRRRFYWEYEGD